MSACRWSRQKQEFDRPAHQHGSLADPALECQRRRQVYRRPAQPEPFLRLRQAQPHSLCRGQSDGAAAHGRHAREPGSRLQRRGLQPSAASAALRAGHGSSTPGRPREAIRSSSHGAPRNSTSATNGMAARRAISRSTASTCGWTTTSILRRFTVDFTGLTPPPTDLATAPRRV